MKMKAIVFIAIVMVSCSTIKNIGGNTYKYKSEKRTLELSFENGSICRLKNTFFCMDIAPNVREITIICNYKRNGDTIFLRNIDCNSDTCKKALTISIPPQESSECFFLSSSSRKRNTTFAPDYATEYEKYGLIPNIDIDTLYVVKNKIILYKRDSLTNVGFIFK